MPKIVLPQNMLSKEQYMALPALQKEEYIHSILKDILEHNPLGVTVSDIKKAAYFGHSTIWHHLEMLASKGECLRMERGDTDVYHLNKATKHFEELELKGTKLGAIYHFDLVENTYGKYIRVQRKIESRSEAHNTRSGIIIADNLLSDFINSLSKIKEYINSNK